MGADLITIRGRFKDKKERYKEIEQTLVKNLSKYLDPEDNWEKTFKIKSEYLELDIGNAFGNWFDAMEYICKDFIENYPDIDFEFYCIEYYWPDIIGEKITYFEGRKRSADHYICVREEWLDESKSYQQFLEDIKFQIII